MGFITTTDEHIASGGTITGTLTIDGDLQVNGGGSLSFDEILEGTQVIDEPLQKPSLSVKTLMVVMFLL